MSPINFPKVYNPANQSREELIDNFVVRTKIFEEIFQDIKNSPMQYPEQPYIIQGIRGQGKTTLLLRIAYEIQNDLELSKRLVPVIFNEEQYNITRLFKLWETTAEYLDTSGATDHLSLRIQQQEQDDDYEKRCFSLIENELQSRGKRVLLFIDNIDDLLYKFSKKEHHRLREIFTESPLLRVIGASSVSLEFHYDYGQPFYQFFKMPTLRGLSAEETQTLLLKLGERYQSRRVQEIIATQPGRVEALRRLTGGVIRTIILLFEIFVDDQNGNAYSDLEKILDSVTPLYKHRMDFLPPQPQEIVDAIALAWDAVSTGEIARKTRLSSKVVSAQLKQLEKYHIIEQVRTGTKNHLYRIAERFFNIWYLMRHGRKWDEKRVRFLVEFLQIWCDQQELATRAEKHLVAVKSGKLCDSHALFLTEALARTSIERQLQHQILAETKNFLENQKSELKGFISASDYELSQISEKEIDSGNPDHAIEILNKIKHKEPQEFISLGILYAAQKNVKKSEESFLQAVKQGDSNAMFNLAFLHETEFKDFAKAEKYYLMAVEKEDAGAMNNLALLYETKFKDFAKAEKYYLMAVEKEHAGAMFDLAFLYATEFKDFTKAEKYYLMAVEKEHAGAMNNLALLYYTEFKDFAKAEKYYLMAVEKEHAGALYNLALLYTTEFKDFAKAEKYYLMAVEKEHANAMNNLAWLYQTEFKDFAKAEKCYLMAVEKEHAGAMFNIAWLYQTEFKDFAKAEKYYLMAMEKGQAAAMNNLAWLYFNQKIKKNEALEYAKTANQKEKSANYAHTLATILLWNDEIDQAIQVAEAFLTDPKAFEQFPEEIGLFIMLLIAKKQYHSAKKLFDESALQLKDRFKPVYHALMFFMQKEHPNEFLKMGSEMKETVEEIIERIKGLEKDYAS
jgi:TPR repeat protein